jgi:hypothetical protein
MNKKAVYFFLNFVLFYFAGRACQCPLTSLSLAECNKYEVIFKGRIDTVRNCDHNFGEAVFIIDELYKGNATKRFKVLFECGVECAMQFNPGEEWIIYSSYKQIGNVKMDWCSRSRKYFKIDKQDFYTETYGNDYSDEVKFLREKLGLHRLIAETRNAAENRNLKPSGNQTIIILLCSMAAIILFYWLFNKFFKF